MAVRSRTTIFNAALTRSGHSTAEGTALWLALDANYDEIVRDCFERGTWAFGKARETLESRSDGEFGYDDAYTMPTDVLHVLEVFFDEVAASDILETWELKLDTNQLLVNADERVIEIEYIRQGLEHTWSSAFALAVQSKLEAVIKDAMDETQESERKDQAADFQLLAAGVKDSKGRSKGPMWKRGGGRLIRSRRGQI